MRDSRARSRRPRPLAGAVGDLRRQITPQTPLAEAQAAWPKAVGDRIAAVTSVIEERDGVLVVDCEGAVWSQELALMEPRLRENLAAAMDGPGPRQIRFRSVS